MTHHDSQCYYVTTNYKLKGVCYLCLADTNFSRKLCFAFLDDLKSEFFVQYGNRIDKVTRPYHFMNGHKSLD